MSNASIGELVRALPGPTMCQILENAMNNCRREILFRTFALKKCPFCGGSPVVETRSDGFDHFPEIERFIYFYACGCCAAQAGWGKSESSARKRWNGRCAAYSGMPGYEEPK